MVTSRDWLLIAGGLSVIGVGAAVLALQQGSSSTASPSGPPQPASCPPGKVSIALVAQGPGMVSGCGGSTRGQTVVCPDLGEACTYTAWPDSGASFRGWQGPDGISSTQNPIAPAAWGPGFIRAVFDPAPGVISMGPNGEVPFRVPDLPGGGVHFEFVWDHVNVAGHWLSIPDFRIA